MVRTGSDGNYHAAMADDTQTREWLAWEQEVAAAAAILRAQGDHARVVRLLEHQATVAMHNAYCSEPIAFPRSGVPTG
jgi:hypothetical protein